MLRNRIINCPFANVSPKTFDKQRKHFHLVVKSLQLTTNRCGSRHLWLANMQCVYRELDCRTGLKELAAGRRAAVSNGSRCRAARRDSTCGFISERCCKTWVLMIISVSKETMRRRSHQDSLEVSLKQNVEHDDESRDEMIKRDGAMSSRRLRRAHWRPTEQF